MKSTDIKNHKTSISQTHNLEVLGSSPSWSTLLLQRLTSNRRPLFFFFHKTYPTEKKEGNWSFCNQVAETFS